MIPKIFSISKVRQRYDNYLNYTNIFLLLLLKTPWKTLNAGAQ